MRVNAAHVMRSHLPTDDFASMRRAIAETGNEAGFE
jgi:hypothetical protein